MKSIVAAVALLLAAGSLVGASESAIVRDMAPAAVIAQFAQAIPPEPPVVGELPEHHQAAAAGAACCRMNANTAATSKPAAATPCRCCRKAAPRTNAKGK